MSVQKEQEIFDPQTLETNPRLCLEYGIPFEGATYVSDRIFPDDGKTSDRYNPDALITAVDRVEELLKIGAASFVVSRPATDKLNNEYVVYKANFPHYKLY